MTDHWPLNRQVVVLDFPEGTDLPAKAQVAVEALRTAGAWPEGSQAHVAIRESARRVLSEFDRSEDGL